ncbi:Ff.00g086370.m01.CDS01 [Fusarium sp. VM40]|nr:Ff.00g086370.m01.CDS01 [Fusarium sp. VM40]
MTFLDTILSVLPDVPFLPPAAPTQAGKDGKPQSGPLKRFTGTASASRKEGRDETTGAAINSQDPS